MLLGFKRQFHQPVREGSKTHTVRDRRKIRPKVGETCHCYGDVRQKTMFLLGRWECTRVQEIVIHPLVQHFEGCDLIYGLRVFIDGAELSAEEAEAFFWRDGFRDVVPPYTSTAMARDFWRDRLIKGPWTGDLIHWSFERPVTRPPHGDAVGVLRRCTRMIKKGQRISLAGTPGALVDAVPPTVEFRAGTVLWVATNSDLVIACLMEKKRASIGEMVSWMRSNGSQGIGITQVDSLVLNLARAGKIKLGKPGVDDSERWVLTRA